MRPLVPDATNLLTRVLVNSIPDEGELETKEATLFKLAPKSLTLDKEKTGFHFSSPSIESHIQSNSWPRHLTELPKTGEADPPGNH